MSPKFDDSREVRSNVAGLALPASVAAWNVVPILTDKKKSSKDKILLSKESCIDKTLKSPGVFMITTNNRFDILHIEDEDNGCNEDNSKCLGVEDIKSVPETYVHTKSKCKVFKSKISKIKQQKQSTESILREISNHKDECTINIVRCDMCFVNHFPYIKFCRWSDEHAHMKKSHKQENDPRKPVTELSKEVIEMINLRINEIKKENSTIHSLSENVPALRIVIVPFIILYVSMNYRAFASSRWDKQHRQKILEQNILKAANLCAKKFENKNISEDKRVLLKYCIKKVKNLFQHEHSVSLSETAKIQTKLDLFDNPFYRHEMKSNILSLRVPSLEIFGQKPCS